MQNVQKAGQDIDAALIRHAVNRHVRLLHRVSHAQESRAGRGGRHPG